MKLLNKIYLAFGSYFLLFGNLNSQTNMVYNGYFEIVDTCPSSIGQISRADGWRTVGGSPDYNNNCNSSNFNVPHAHMGYQQDCCGGRGIAGEYMMCSEYTPGDDICREYMGTKLLDTLQAGHKYLASMYVNRANYNYSLATIGMLFTDTAIILPNPQHDPMFIANPQVKNVAVITDTLNWTLVQDTFIAVGNEAYLTIGNFNTTATSDTLWQAPNASLADGGAYYYIDGVSVYDVATMGIEQLAVSNEQLNIYPNPASTVLQVTLNNKPIAAAKIYDLLGNEILQIQQKEIDVSGLNNGVYFLNVKTNNGILTKKIIVQH